MSARAASELKHVAGTQSDLNDHFAVGEEAEANVDCGREVETAPSYRAAESRATAAFAAATRCVWTSSCAPRRSDTFFPGGTVDAYDTWLELKGTDDKGQTIFWSGMVEDNGKGPVEKGAHFYRSLQIDAHGNPINKRNAWATRAVVYVTDSARRRRYRSLRCTFRRMLATKSRCMRACATANFPGGTRSSPSPECLIRRSRKRM